jgi:DNA polymerase III subunit delta
MAPNLKPAYLIHGDDHGRIAERRTSFRRLAEANSGAAGIEVFEGEQSTPETVAAALNAMTFAIGRRFIVVDGVERWKDKEVEPVVAALKHPDPDTTISFFAREEGRMKVPQALADAVKKAGGDVAIEAAIKPWELPKWTVQQARQLGLSLSPDAAKALVSHVGDRQQRLLRELEKIALEVGAVKPGPRDPRTADLVSVDAETIDEMTPASAERKAWSFADALLSGDPAIATQTYLQIRQQGERLPGLIYWMSTRLRDAHKLAQAIEQGQSESDAKRLVRMPPKAAEQLLNDARRIGCERLKQAIELIADLELSSRGGGSRGMTEDTSALVAIRQITAA